MAAHETFRFRTLDDLRERTAGLGLDIPYESDVRALGRPVDVGGRIVPNALAVHPMEGCDGLPDGSPGPLTLRRYERFAAGGAGLLWFEACAVAHEGRANPRQLWLQRSNLEAFREMLRMSRCTAAASRGKDHHPLCILQLTHSGRYSRPDAGPRPRIVQHSVPLDTAMRLPESHPVLTDEEIERIEDLFVEAALLAREAGFDGVDIKHCHGYLGSELLGARTRTGRYGGSFENRTRFLRNVVNRVRDAAPDLLVCARLNVFDAIPYPYGWGVPEGGDGRVPDLTEPIRLVRELEAQGVRLLNISAGNPYYNPHIGRPFDLPLERAYVPDEHPLEGVARLLGLARDIQAAVPDVACVGTGYSWLRQYLGAAAEGVVRHGWARFVGAGREAFAYPGFAGEILDHGTISANRACIACSSCSQLMRDGSVTGCVPRDKDAYAPIFIEGRKRDPDARKAPRPVARHM